MSRDFATIPQNIVTNPQLNLNANEFQIYLPVPFILVLFLVGHGLENAFQCGKQLLRSQTIMDIHIAVHQVTVQLYFEEKNQGQFLWT
jgi:hypothetical protein